MENVSIQEKKKVIMKFMGVEPTKFMNVYQWSDQPFFMCSHETVEEVIDSISNYIKYDSDWNKLHEVIDKIESIVLDDENSFNVTIGATNLCVIQDSYGEICEVSEQSSTKLLTVFETIYKFLVGYNEFLNEKNEQ